MELRKTFKIVLNICLLLYGAAVFSAWSESSGLDSYGQKVLVFIKKAFQ